MSEALLRAYAQLKCDLIREIEILEARAERVAVDLATAQGALVMCERKIKEQGMPSETEARGVEEEPAL